MKKIFFLFLISILISTQAVFSIEEKYGEYFSYKKETRTYVFNKLDKASISKMDKAKQNEYKKAAKYYKLYLKDKHSKILSKEPTFIPSLYALYYKSYNSKKYNLALGYLNKINETNSEYDKVRLNLMYFRTYYKMNEYTLALKHEQYIKNEKQALPYIADCYLNIVNYEKAIEYAKKVTPSEDNYYLAQILLFKAYYRQNKKSEARTYAYNLIKIQPDAYENYIRLALCENNKNQKLKHYYKARKLAPIDAQKKLVNADIMQLEQEKIDNAVKHNKNFIEKPDWKEIREGVEYANNEYWYERQDAFYKGVNDCINKYSGAEIGKCFNSIANKQKDINKNLTQKLQEERDRVYQETIIKQNERMIRMQAIQNFTNTMNQIQTNNNLNNINNSIRQQNMYIQNTNMQLRNTNMQLYNMNNSLYSW